LIPCEVDLAEGVLAVSPASAADAPALVEHALQVAGESDFLTAGSGERRMTPALQSAFLDRLQTRGLGFVLKGELRGRMVAVLSVVRPEQPRLHHRADLGLTVRSDYWGRGIGRSMVGLGIRLARSQGVRKLNLTVRADNQRALRLYHSMGFEPEGTSARALRVGRRFFAEVSMGLCLDPGAGAAFRVPRRRESPSR
jgi:RimJ/RimL family protein N-acetyltransferase